MSFAALDSLDWPTFEPGTVWLVGGFVKSLQTVIHVVIATALMRQAQMAHIYFNGVKYRRQSPQRLQLCIYIEAFDKQLKRSIGNSCGQVMNR